MSFEENLDAFFFNRDSLITINPSFTLSSNMTVSGFYVGILRCLSQRINTIKDMCKVLNAESGKISTYLEELIKAEIVTKSTYFNSKRNTYYEINDRMTSFFFRFTQPYIDHIKLGNGERIKEREHNAINEFINRAYEKVCTTYIKHLNNQGKLEHYYLDFYNFKADNTSIGRSVEIDLLAEEKDTLLIGECKFSKNKKGLEVYLEMKDDVEIEPLKSYNNKHFYIFSHSGFKDELINLKSNNLHLISSIDMLLK